MPGLLQSPHQPAVAELPLTVRRREELPWFLGLRVRCLSSDVEGANCGPDRAPRPVNSRAAGRTGKTREQLLPDAEAADDALIAAEILALEVVEQAAASADHLHEPKAGVIVLR